MQKPPGGWACRLTVSNAGRPTNQVNAALQPNTVTSPPAHPTRNRSLMSPLREASLLSSVSNMLAHSTLSLKYCGPASQILWPS